jgi:DNA polymerase/3'-5' exonuclease PolX
MVKVNKEIIIKNLENFRDYEKFNKNIYKVKAYDNVINNIIVYPKEISSIDDLKDIKGIGKSIHEKLLELFKTGKIAINDKLYKFKKELINVYGIGPANIEKIIENGITSISQLKKNVFCLNDKQKMGLKYYKDLKKRIPLKEFNEHKKILEKDLTITTYDFVGSYRRGNKTMGDIDIIIMKNPKFDLKEYINSLNILGYIKDVLALGNNKFMGIVQLDQTKPARRLDILIAPANEYYYSLLYFTGSNVFNIGMRAYVKNKLGLSLSEHGFDKIKPDIKSEKDIFDFLNLKYVEPKNRTSFIQ